MIQERRGRWERMGAGYVEEIVIQEEDTQPITEPIIKGGWGQKSISTIPWVGRKPLLSFYFIKNMLQTGKKFVRIQRALSSKY